MVSGVQFNRGKEHWSEWFLKFPYRNIKTLILWSKNFKLNFRNYIHF